MRRKADVEAQVHEIIALLRAGQTTEDDATVELKADAEPSQRIARRLAGHANSARGAPILWVIGLDEGRPEDPVRGTTIDMGHWWPQVASHFDEQMAPAHQVVAVRVDGKTVLALDIETDRGPFVVKATQRDVLEVPYRESTSVRSAKRADLLRMMAAASRRPRLEVVYAELTASTSQPGGLVTMSADVYWHLPLGDEIVLRDADASARIWHYEDAPEDADRVSLLVPRTRTIGDVSEGLSRVRLRSDRRYTSLQGEQQLFLDGPGPGTIIAAWQAEPEGVSTGRTLNAMIGCRVLDDEAMVTAEFRAQRDINPDWQRSHVERAAEPLVWRYGTSRS